MSESENSYHIVCYESSAIDTSDDSDYVIDERVDKTQIAWQFRTRTFADEKEAKLWLEEPGQAIFSRHYTNTTFDGDKVYYRCNLVKKHGPQCSQKIRLHYNATDSRVFLSQTSNQHNHEQINANVVKYGLNRETKQAIQKIWASGFKMPKEISQQLEKEKAADPKSDIKIPGQRQLYNYLANNLKDPKSIKKATVFPGEVKIIKLDEEYEPGCPTDAVSPLRVKNQRETQIDEEIPPQKQRAKRRTRAEMVAARSAENAENEEPNPRKRLRRN